MKPLTRERLLTVLEDLSAHVQVPGGVKNILVADDEPDELHLFARMLESDPHGYRVLQATNGKRVLEMLRSRKPDLLLLDLFMPVMSGFQVLEEKRKDPAVRDIPVIVISSRDPLGEAITSNTIRVSHNGGFSTNHLLEIFQTVTQIIIPPPASTRRVEMAAVVSKEGG
jgi:CheY-like chemotaxis protein